MSSKNMRPKWWQLYLTFPCLIVLFTLDSRLKISTRLHQFMQIGILVIVYGLIHLWLKANAEALSYLDHSDHHGKVHVIQIFSDSPIDHHKLTMFHLPDSEIKGLLNNTYEMGVIDVEAYPVEEVSQKLNKE